MNNEVKHEIPIGTKRCICSGCGEFIFFVRTGINKIIPVNKDGINHFDTCSAEEEFRNRPKVSKKPQESEKDAGEKQNEFDIF